MIMIVYDMMHAFLGQSLLSRKFKEYLNASPRVSNMLFYEEWIISTLVFEIPYGHLSLLETSKILSLEW